MKIFITKYVDNYSHGGVVAVAEDLERFKELVDTMDVITDPLAIGLDKMNFYYKGISKDEFIEKFLPSIFNDAAIIAEITAFVNDWSIGKHGYNCGYEHSMEIRPDWTARDFWKYKGNKTELPAGLYLHYEAEVDDPGPARIITDTCDVS